MERVFLEQAIAYVYSMRYNEFQGKISFTGLIGVIADEVKRAFVTTL